MHPRNLGIALLMALVATTARAPAAQGAIGRSAHEHVGARDAAAAPGEAFGFCGTRTDGGLEMIRLRAARPLASPLPTPFSTDAGEIAVLEDDGTFFIADAVGHPLLDLAPVARAFYRTHGDDYDFLAFYLASGLDDWLGSSGALASAFVIRNDIQGIGLGTFDLAASFGEPPTRLQMMMKMNGLHRYPDDPFEEFPNDSLNPVEVLAHEMAHRWVAYTWVDSAGSIVPALLGRGNAHWNFFLDSEASIMEGCDWSAVAPDSFESSAVMAGFSHLEHYLMGLRTRSEVDSFFVINSPTNIIPPGDYVPWSIPYVGITMNGVPTWWKLDDIEAVEGPRNPASAGMPDTIRVGFVLVTAQGQAATPEDLAKLEALRQAIPSFWDAATAGRGAVAATLESRAGSVRIDHVPLKDTEDSLSTRALGAVIRIAQAGIPIALDPASARVFWRAGTAGAFTELLLSPAGGDSFSATLPALPAGGVAQYYLHAASDSAGIDAFHPPAGAAAPHSYVAGADHHAPDLVHTPVPEQGQARLPQTLLARVTDNVGVDSVWVEYGPAGAPLASSAPAGASSPDSFTASIGSGFLEGQALEYRLHARDRAGNETVSQGIPHTMHVGRDWVFDAENGEDGFTHLTYSGSYRDIWHLTTEDASPSSPGTSWKSGGPPGTVYPAHVDGYLNLPFITNIEPGTMLRFDHRYDLEEAGTPPYAWDGAYVQAWTAATNWVTLVPNGGYTHAFWSNAGPFVQGAPCWSGNSGGWVSESVDLSAYAGEGVLFRFRMVADEFVGGEGWFVDHIRVDYPGTNVALESVPPAFAVGAAWPNPARGELHQTLSLPRSGRVSWELFDVAGRRVATLWRGTAAAGAFDLSAHIPAGLRSGLYFTRIEVDGLLRATGRVVLLN